MASMMSYITPTSIVSNIRMYRTKEKNKSFLLVEGESDVGFYKNLIDKKQCKIISLSGKEKLEKAIYILNTQNVQGVVAVIDRDYDEFLGQQIEEENLYCTDTHDVETMILKTGAYERFVNEFGNDTKIEYFETERGNSVLEEVLNMANWIGTLRFLNMRCKWGISLKNIKLSQCITDTMELQKEQVIDCTLPTEEKKELRAEIVETLERELKKGHDPWKVSRGHDMASIIGIFFAGYKQISVGNERAKRIDGKDVESAIRLAYREEDFEKTVLYADIKKWQDNNPTWIVLKNKIE